MTEEEYRAEWLAGKHQTDYNACRFAEDKVKFARDWAKARMPDVDIDDPKNIVDRINRYKIYDTDPRKPVWADKIAVLGELRDMGLGHIIIPPVLTCRGRLAREDFDSLPDGKYIFKCNHGSGWNMKFEKKSGNDPTYMLGKLDEWCGLDYAYIGGWEWQYHEIVPGVIVQPDMGNILLDWQFWCENGEIEYIQLSRKLGKNYEEYIAFTDNSGIGTDSYIGLKPLRFKLLSKELSIYEKMKPIVKQLASDFKFVRVDLYYINNQIYFGELTFSPCSGKLALNIAADTER